MFGKKSLLEFNKYTKNSNYIDYLHKFPLFKAIKDNSDPAGFLPSQPRNQRKGKILLIVRNSFRFLPLTLSTTILFTFTGKI